MLMQSAVNARQFHPAVAAAAPGEREAVDMMGVVMTFKRNAEIYGENEAADYLYKVISGAVRTYKVLADGRRQIGSFYLPGDVFGLEVGSEHAFSAEAVTDTRVLVTKRSVLVSRAERDASAARQLWEVAARELRRAQEHALALIKTAEERVAGFLMDMAKRSSQPDRIDLPMSRQDIADYLGLTIETVSRTFTHLEAIAAIDLPSSRRVVLRNRAALSRLTG